MLVPSKKAMIARIPRWKNLYASKREPNFVGYSVTEIDFTLTAWNGGGSPPSGYDATIYTKSASACTRSGRGYSCKIEFAAPSATDTYNVRAKWCSAPNSDGSCPGTATLTLISEGNFTVVVPANGTADASLTLDPVVGRLSWNASAFGWANGPNAPTLKSGQYVCGSGSSSSSGCYYPLLNDVAKSGSTSSAATPTNGALGLNVSDAAGDLVVPATGSYSSSRGVFTIPLYLTSSGSVDDISASCSDTHLQLVKSSASAPVGATVPQGDLANGFTGAAYSAMNAPGGDGIADGASATSLSGNSVTVATNDVAYVNFDGGSASYTSSSLDTCTATDSQSLASPKLYVGYDFGNVVVP